MKILVRLIAIAIAAVIALVVGAKFLDGPWGLLPGGVFKSGETVVGAEPDWSFVHDIQEVEFQLLEPAGSRTTWIVDHQGKAYIPCGYMTSWWGKLWKQWPIHAEKDGRAIVRIEGKLYERQLVRVTQGPALEPLLAELERKYPIAQGLDIQAVESGGLWIFELAPRKS